MKSILLASSIVVILVGAVGCGLKGPLYFPSDEKPKQTKGEVKSVSIEKNQSLLLHQ